MCMLESVIRPCYNVLSFYIFLFLFLLRCTRKTVEHDQRLFTLAMLISHYLVYNTRGVLDADAISGMASVSTWTQRLLRSEGTGGGPLNSGGNGSVSPSSLRDDTGGSQGLSPVHGSTGIVRSAFLLIVY